MAAIRRDAGLLRGWGEAGGGVDYKRGVLVVLVLVGVHAFNRNSGVCVCVWLCVRVLNCYVLLKLGLWYGMVWYGNLQWGLEERGYF